MLTFNGHSHVQARVGGVALDAKRVLLDFAIVRIHRLFKVPTLELRVTDIDGFFADKNPLIDGALVEIMITQSRQEVDNWMTFRLFGSAVVSKVGNMTKYHVTGYYNCKNYFYDIVTQTFRGNSSEIAKYIARNNSLATDIDDTSDDSTWICASQRLAQFFYNDVVPRSQVNGGLMVAGVDARNNTLYYKDLNKIIVGKPKHTFSNVVSKADNFNLVFEFGLKSDSGFGNKDVYGTVSSVYSVKDGAHVDSGKSTVNKLGKDSLNVNKNMVANSNRMIMPLDVNDRQKQLAGVRHNHVRMSSFSTHADFLLRTGSNVRLFDLVTAAIFDTESRETDVTGDYVVEGLVIAASPTEYVEKICCISNTINRANSDLVN